MWSYSEEDRARTKAYAACACGENLATAVRGPRSTPTVTRITRSSLLSPVTAKETSSCSAASVARAARHLRVAPRRGRSWTWTTTVSGSAWLMPGALNALRSMLIAPCHVLQGEICLIPSAATPTTLAVSYAVLRPHFGRSCPCRCRSGTVGGRPGSVCQSQARSTRADLSARGRLSASGSVRVPLSAGRFGRGGRGRERGERPEAVGGHLRGEEVGLGDLPVDLFPVDRDLARGLEAEADGATAHLDDVDLDVVADADRLADAAGECEHRYPSMGVGGRPWQCPPNGRVQLSLVDLTATASRCHGARRRVGRRSCVGPDVIGGSAAGWGATRR